MWCVNTSQLRILKSDWLLCDLLLKSLLEANRIAAITSDVKIDFINTEIPILGEWRGNVHKFKLGISIGSFNAVRYM